MAVRVLGGSLRLLAVTALLAQAAGLAPTKKSTPKVGSCYEMRTTDKDYLKGHQIVGMTDPEAPKRRPVDPKTGRLGGPRFKSATVWWVKEGGGVRTKTGKLPFKVRLLRYNPTGVLHTLHEQGRVQLYGGADSDGEMIYSVKLARPKPWWKKLV